MNLVRQSTWLDGKVPYIGSTGLATSSVIWVMRGEIVENLRESG
jgi:hypothetical protein